MEKYIYWKKRMGIASLLGNMVRINQISGLCSRKTISPGID